MSNENWVPISTREAEKLLSGGRPMNMEIGPDGVLKMYRRDDNGRMYVLAKRGPNYFLREGN